MKTSLWGLAKSSHPRPWKRAPSKVTAPRKRIHLAACLIFTHEICRQTAFHIILRCSKPMEGLMTAVNYKMADLSRGAKKKKKKERERRRGYGKNGKNTLWFSEHRPHFCSSSPWDQTRRRIWTSKSFPSSGELPGPAEWVRRVRSYQAEASQQHFARKAERSPLTLPAKAEQCRTLKSW